jgi:para-aminobenzoate synthetase component I
MRASPKVYKDHSISKSNIRIVAQNAEHVFYLDSCNQSDALNLGKYELVLGMGQSSRYDVLSNEIIDWELIDSITSDEHWCFYVLGYDMKNQIHKLDSTQQDTMEWPILTIVVPEIVVAITKSNELLIWADKPDDIWHQLINSTVLEQNTKSGFDKSVPSMTKEEYVEKVDTIRGEIAKGNVYEMNLCIEYALHNFNVDVAFSMFEKLVEHSPTPFSAYVKIANRHVICASPERFISKQKSKLYSQPIKGTSSRFEDFEKDQRSRDHLFTSEKERAEHVMIVDLVRNDLARNSLKGSTRVEELFGVYTFAQVHHMVSTISSDLLPEIKWSEIVKNTFPMGSMTGAPKYIAMQYIDSLEACSRGNYSGSIGYIEPNGDFDSNVVIRSLLFDSEENLATFSVGGAITYDSNPEAEYEECQLKASAIRKVFGI